MSEAGSERTIPQATRSERIAAIRYLMSDHLDELDDLLDEDGHGPDCVLRCFDLKCDVFHACDSKEHG